MKLEDYMTEQAIYRVLARLRVRIADKRHADDLYWRVTKGAPNPADCHDGDTTTQFSESSVCKCLPSRRQWGRSTRKVRPTLPYRKMLEEGILYAIRRQCKKGGLLACDWGRRLRALIDDISERLDDGHFLFQPPTLVTIPKSTTESRCLAKFENLSDRLILSQTARYIRDRFDDLLSPDSYAFRRSGEISHVTAIRKLRDYRLRHIGKKLWVAECDIQKFFDVINHEEVLAAFDSFAQQLDAPIDPRAREVLIAFLKSYSSFRSAVEEFPDPEERKKISFLTSQELASQLKRLYGTTDFTSLPLGIPQGGALSPILVNLVMDCADHAVTDGAPEDLFYARFCDDMIIVHPDKKVCTAAFERFVSKMEALRLPVHKVCKRFTYGTGFYGDKAVVVKDGYLPMPGKKLKSKGPYAWTDVHVGGGTASPWISFLGQQIRFDGAVRVRFSSIEKHRAKLRKEASRLIRACGKKGQKLRNPDAVDDVYAAFRQRLMALGVGYSSDAERGSAEDRCWMSAFPGITRCPWTRQQMRKLDRERDAVLCKVRHGPLAHLDGTPAKADVKFLGRPFSYVGYLEREDRPDQWLLTDNVSVYSEW